MKLNDRVRVCLLATSYLDAVESGRGDAGGGSGKPSARMLEHNRELWPQGSYAELERASDLLRMSRARHHLWFWRVYVTRTVGKVSLATTVPRDLSPHKRHFAEQGLTFATEYVKRATGGNIFVPAVISENACRPGEDASFSPGDIKAAARPRSKWAA